MKNDEIIGAGHRAFSKMASDSAGTSSASMDIDRLYLEQVQTRLVHNLRVIDQLLGDQKRFPAVPKNDDERDAMTMRSQILAVTASQRSALDLISSTLDTEAMGQMQHDLNDQMKSASGQVAPQPIATSDPVSFIGTAGLPEYLPAAGVPSKNGQGVDARRAHRLRSDHCVARRDAEHDRAARSRCIQRHRQRRRQLPGQPPKHRRYRHLPHRPSNSPSRRPRSIYGSGSLSGSRTGG